MAATTTAARMAPMGPAGVLAVMEMGQRSPIWYVSIAVIILASILLYPQARKWKWDQPGELLAAGAIIAGVLSALPIIMALKGRKAIPKGMGTNLLINSAMVWMTIILLVTRISA